MPPPSYDIGDELSLRHLPDLSDASFSFQILSTLSKGDLLLGDDGADFFRDADDNMTTPGPSSQSSFLPLKLSDITPKPKSNQTVLSHHNQQSKPPSPTPPTFPKPRRTPRGIGKVLNARARVEETRAASKPKLKHAFKVSQMNAGSPAAARLETLRAEVQRLNNDYSDLHSDPTTVPQEREPPIKSQGPTQAPPIATSKSTVISSGISKVRSKTNLSTSKTTTTTFPRTIASVPQYHLPVQPLLPVHHVPSDNAELNQQNPDTSICSMLDGGVAERLVMYSQKLIGSYGSFIPESKPNVPPSASNPEPSQQQGTLEVPDNRSSRRDDDDNDDDGPFTLSQLSPCKPTPPPFPTQSGTAAAATIAAATIPLSPMRPSRKRPVSAASVHHSLKKGKYRAGAAAASRQVMTDAAATGGHAPAIRLNSSSGSGSSSRRLERIRTKAKKGVTRKKNTTSTSTLPTARHGHGHYNHHQTSMLTEFRGVPGPAIEGNDNNGDDDDDTSRLGLDSSGSRSGNTLRFSRTSNNLEMTDNSVNRKEDEERVSNTGSSSRRDKRIVELRPLVNPTKPVGFKFELDARMEARKAEYERSLARSEKKEEKKKKKKQKHNSMHVPDFKTMHAIQQAETAQRKENIVPIKPISRELHTDERAREREKFDERVREKQREMERAMEERRREREEDEEREVRELRKRAIPRAHEVPEWYKEAPKRKKKRMDVDCAL